MAVSEEKALKILQEIAREAEVTKPVKAVVYRADYQDYIVVIGSTHYFELREKLITDFSETQNIDLKREIVFKIKHPIELEDWQKEEMGISEEMTEEDLDAHRNKDGTGGADLKGGDDFRKKSVVDDSDKYDWLK